MSSYRLYNSELCSDIWNRSEKVYPKIRMQLLKLANEFYKKTNFVAPIIDIYLMGSIASYNWTPDSDVDVHVIVDYNKLQMPPDTANKMVKSMGAIWNKEHDIKINGHKVELNIQNYNEKKPYVEGIYSLIHDKWIRKPVKKTLIVNKEAIIEEYHKMVDLMVKAIQSDSITHIERIKTFFDEYRQYGLDHGGELSLQNIVFKILRAKGYVRQLKDRITQLYDKNNSISDKNQFKNIVGDNNKIEEYSDSNLDLKTCDYIGTVYDGEVRAVPVKDAKQEVHFKHNMVSGMNSLNWRYYRSKNKVMWNTPPLASDKSLVEDFLRKRGITNIKQSSMYTFTENYNTQNDIDNKKYET